VFKLNFARRQMSKSQSAAAQAKLLDFFEEQAKERQRAARGRRRPRHDLPPMSKEDEERHRRIAERLPPLDPEILELMAEIRGENIDWMAGLDGAESAESQDGSPEKPDEADSETGTDNQQSEEQDVSKEGCANGRTLDVVQKGTGTDNQQSEEQDVSKLVCANWRTPDIAQKGTGTDNQQSEEQDVSKEGCANGRTLDVAQKGTGTDNQQSEEQDVSKEGCANGRTLDVAQKGADQQQSEEQDVSKAKKPRRAVDDAAAVGEASARSITRARRIMRQGVPELFAAVEAGRISVNRGVEALKFPKDVQREIARTGKLPSAPEQRRSRGKDSVDAFVDEGLKLARREARRKRGLAGMSDAALREVLVTYSHALVEGRDDEVSEVRMSSALILRRARRHALSCQEDTGRPRS
jgi:hypothetical protein